MDLMLYTNLWVFVCALIGLFYGAIKFFKNSKVLFLHLITFGVASMMFARLFQVIYIIIQGELTIGFNIGMLGMAASFLFLLSANYGQMDSLVDDGTKKFLPIRVISLLAPIALIGSYVMVFIDLDVPGLLIGIGVVMVMMLPCSYYNLKHIIIFDVNQGLVKPLRAYNILAILYAVCVCMEFVGVFCWQSTPVFIGSMAVQGLLMIIILPVAGKGVAKWTI